MLQNTQRCAGVWVCFSPPSSDRTEEDRRTSRSTLHSDCHSPYGSTEVLKALALLELGWLYERWQWSGVVVTAKPSTSRPDRGVSWGNEKEFPSSFSLLCP